MVDDLKPLRLGIIGLSEGNGHPYSWSAIFNGYDPISMASCPFPAIPSYLAKQSFPGDAISNAKVTHVWTQNRAVSEHIALASRVDHVVDNYTEMIGNVDAILLARDDAELHYEISAPFLRAGLPVYIDKPLAITTAEANLIYAMEQYDGQVFTCSALRYSKDLTLSAELQGRVGEIVYVHATVMKSWERYAVHIIEPVLQLLRKQDEQGVLLETQRNISEDRHIVSFRWESGLQATFAALGGIPCSISIKIFGKLGQAELIFGDTFFAFREALKAFINSVRMRAPAIPRSEVLRVVELIEHGL